MTDTVTMTPKRRRWCKRGHDTHVTGRFEPSGNCKACQDIKNAEKEERRKEGLRRASIASPVPGLLSLRLSRGHSLKAIADECKNLCVTQLAMIESQTRYATRAERVEIFQAFNVLEYREREEREAEMEREARRVRAGVG